MVTTNQISTDYKQKLEKTKEEISEYMSTDLGKWCVVVGKKC